MDNGVDMVFSKKLICCRSIAEVHFHERHLPAQNGTDAFVVGFVAIAEIVGNEYVVASLNKFYCYVASDKSGPAGYKNGLFHRLQR